MRLFVLLGSVLAVFLIGGAASAASITFGLDFEFSGADEPQSPTTPWATATLDDSFGGANTVRLTMTADNLVGSENIKGFYLNFDPLLDSSLLSFSAVDVTASTPSVTSGNNLYMADGDGKYDILFDFPPPPGDEAGLFTAGETVIYDITFVSPITASSFDYFSVESTGNGSYLAAAHIQRIYQDASGSGWIGAVPEPGTGLLAGLGLALLGASRRRR